MISDYLPVKSGKVKEPGKIGFSGPFLFCMSGWSGPYQPRTPEFYAELQIRIPQSKRPKYAKTPKPVVSREEQAELNAMLENRAKYARRVIPPTKNCQVCNKPFRAYGKNQRMCSRACSGRYASIRYEQKYLQRQEESSLQETLSG